MSSKLYGYVNLLLRTVHKKSWVVYTRTCIRNFNIFWKVCLWEKYCANACLPAYRKQVGGPRACDPIPRRKKCAAVQRAEHEVRVHPPLNSWICMRRELTNPFVTRHNTLSPASQRSYYHLVSLLSRDRIHCPKIIKDGARGNGMAGIWATDTCKQKPDI